LKKVREKGLRERVREIIEQVEQIESLRGMTNIKKLQGGRDYYRIRVGDYRMGLTLEGDTVVFVRFLHRKDIYRYFP
jgi:mRNA interferase RelE/StbE